MPVKAFPFSKIEDNVQNVYEAVIVAAKRARQINDDQMVIVRNTMETEESVPETEELIIREPIDVEQLPKPVVTALDELVSNSIEFEYIAAEED